MQAGGNIVLLAQTTGTLTFEDGCLRLSSHTERHLLIWRPGHSASWRNGRITVFDGPTEVAWVGEALTVGGGEIRAGETPNADAHIEEQIRQRIPSQCRLGLYWKVGGVLGNP